MREREFSIKMETPEKVTESELSAIKRDVARGYRIAKKKLGMPDDITWDERIGWDVRLAHLGA